MYSQTRLLNKIPRANESSTRSLLRPPAFLYRSLPQYKKKEGDPALEQCNPNHGKRATQDCMCLLIFCTYMVGSVGLAYMSFSQGRLAKLYRGIDMYGNVCGMDQASQSQNITVTNPPLNTVKKPLYYPFYAEFQHTGFFMTFGLCVEECPNFPGRKMMFSSSKSQVMGKSGYEQYTSGARTNTLWYEDPGEAPPASNFSQAAYSLMYGSNYNVGDKKIHYDYNNAGAATKASFLFDFANKPPSNAPRDLPENTTDYSFADWAYVYSGLGDLTPRAVGDWRYPCAQTTPSYAPAGTPNMACRGYPQSWTCNKASALLRGETCVDEEDPTTPERCTSQEQAQARRTCYGNFPLYNTIAYYKSYCFPNITELAEKEEAKAMYAAFKNATTGGAAVLRRTMSDVVDSQQEIIGSCVVCILLGFVWLRFLQCMAKCMVWSVLIGSVLMMWAMGYVFYSMGSDIKADGGSLTDYQPYQITGYVFFGLGALLICFICFKRTAIMVAIEVIEEASKAVRFLWLLPFYPIITCAFVVLFALYSVASLILLLACGELTFGEQSGVRMMTFDDTMAKMMWYQVFAFFWMNAFVVDFGKLVVAMAVAMWYFADNPQVPTTEEKDGWKYLDPSLRPKCNKIERQRQKDDGIADDELIPEQGPPGSALPREPFATLQAVQISARYHIGSVAFGAFIIAVVRLVQAYLLWLEATSAQYKDNYVVKCLFCIIQCYLKCLESCVEFINKNAYIQIGLFGKNFCSSAYQGFTLVMRNIIMVGTLDGITDALIFVGKICITLMSTLFCHIMLLDKVESGEISTAYPALILVFLLCWFISGAFLATYDMATDTLLICILEDKERFSGPEARNYWCDELEAILDANGGDSPSPANANEHQI